ncbi:hypothetical protein NDA01_31145 [Trichocoleus desertorum AS-A10]|uniref:hypothetical protein n=1 Tax=Trichocoleus desertorum TaxID=1481672 RepID=UPI00329C89B8
MLAEAILTIQSASGKAKILQGICDRLKPRGKFLSHELRVNDREDEIHRALAAAIRVNSTPLSETNWIATCQTAGLQVLNHQTGVMGLLNPARVIQDEGLIDASKFFWNVLTRPQLRDRLLTMRQVFKQYEHELGYLILCAEQN